MLKASPLLEQLLDLLPSVTSGPPEFEKNGIVCATLQLLANLSQSLELVAELVSLGLLSKHLMRFEPLVSKSSCAGSGGGQKLDDGDLQVKSMPP